MTGLQVEEDFTYSHCREEMHRGTECPGEQICIWVWDRVAKSKTDKTSSIHKVCTQCFQLSDFFFFSCYQNILLCKAHHRKCISPAQLQHNASHHGWLGENAGWVGSVFRICNWSISPGFLITHCGRIPLYPLYGGTKILHCSIHKVNGKNQQKTWLHQCLLSFLQETDWWLY